MSAEPEGTHFLNVDLDVFSKTPLDPLADAFGAKVVVLHSGKRGRRYSAHFEVGEYVRNPHADRLIGRLVHLVKRLPRSARRLWNNADVREFNIGIEAAKTSPVFELRLRPETVAAVAGVRGRIAVTIYGPQRLMRRSLRRRRKKKA